MSKAEIIAYMENEVKKLEAEIESYGGRQDPEALDAIEELSEDIFSMERELNIVRHSTYRPE